MKKVIFILAIFFVSSYVLAQNNLIASKDFFNKQIKSYQKWLNNSKFSQVITYSSIDIQQNRLVLNLLITNENDWHSIQYLSCQGDNNSLSELLFYKFIHIMELEKSECLIKLTDKKKYFINIEFINNELITREPNPRGEIEGSFQISVKEIGKRFVVTEKDSLKGNLLLIRQQIAKFIDSYYSKKYARDPSSPAKYKPIDEYENTIDLRVSNITSEIINDRTIGFYELISIHLVLYQSKNFVKIKYLIQGKYGSGIFSAPRQNDYYDMEAEYKSYLEQYIRNLKINIRNYLQN